MRGDLAVLVASGVLLCVLAAHAHHGLAAVYDGSRMLEIEGTLVEFLFRNPHSEIHIVTADEHGDTRRWEAEWSGVGVLAAYGVSRDSLRAGDRVVITGNPSRDPESNRLHLRSIVRPTDGFGWGFEGEGEL